MPPIPLPDRRQQDAHSCGPTVYRIVCEALGVKAPGPKADPMDGLHPAYLSAQLQKVAKLPTVVGTLTVDDLKHFTRAGRPVVCLVRLGNSGHYVVVAGVERGKVVYQCPATGPGRQPVDEFVARWHDTDGRGHAYERWGLAVGPAASAG